MTVIIFFRESKNDVFELKLNTLVLSAIKILFVKPLLVVMVTLYLFKYDGGFTLN